MRHTIPEKYRQPSWGPLDGLFKRCLTGSTILGVLVLAVVFLAPHPPEADKTVDEIPERFAKVIKACAADIGGKILIGPSTVGGVVAGAFKIANTAGILQNIVACKLHQSGSVGFVSKSGGLSNEAYKTIALNTDGLYEGVAIGGD